MEEFQQVPEKPVTPIFWRAFRIRRVLWGVVLAAVLFLLFGGYMVKLLDYWSLLPREQAVTELYLAEPRPGGYASTTDPLTFSFVVSNQSSVARSYRYEVYAEDGAARIPIDMQSVTVIPWERKVVAVQTLRTLLSTSSRIVIELPEEDQHIYFSLAPRR